MTYLPGVCVVFSTPRRWSMSSVVIRGRRGPVTVGKIVCIGGNFVEHNKEMGRADKAEALLFLKPSTAIIPGSKVFKIPPFTNEVHHEVEMVVLLGKGGKRISPQDAPGCIEAVGVGLDMTARDMQRVAKKHGMPWAVPKGFDGAAVLSEFVPFTSSIDMNNLSISLKINGTIRQEGNTANMILDPASLISYASRFFTLLPGDLIYTGTPEGVGPVKAGDELEFSLGDLVMARITVEEETDVERC
jgi:2-keto-4-pentenoate hydratase/2-oxohepta-3-ene-1,7-dioic acid hydratase in catechol pathway